MATRNLARGKLPLLTITLALAASTAHAGEASRAKSDDTYTLYRTAAVTTNGDRWRIHVATFDAWASASTDATEGNRENCEIARRLFQAQPGVTVRYWCEAGVAVQVGRP